MWSLIQRQRSLDEWKHDILNHPDVTKLMCSQCLVTQRKDGSHSARSPSIKIGLPVTWAGKAPIGKPTSPGTLRNSTKPIYHASWSNGLFGCCLLSVLRVLSPTFCSVGLNSLDREHMDLGAKGRPEWDPRDPISFWHGTKWVHQCPFQYSH